MSRSFPLISKDKVGGIDASVDRAGRASPQAAARLDHSATIDLPDTLADIFGYLDNLRESGVSNMIGAVPFLMGDLHMSRSLAGVVLAAWLRTFDRDKSTDERAAIAKTRGVS